MATREAPRYGSDVVIDLLAALEIPYVTLNPGASFRGLHDSLVNRPGAPGLILCSHEKLAIQIAHGYAKATGRPLATMLHDVVGLLHGSLGVFEAFLDRAPVLLLGGAGPMDTAHRRPGIDWLHTASLQGLAVRDYTKWHDQPASVAAFPEAIVRAHRVALSEPAGPVYLAFDADLQEQPLTEPAPALDLARLRPAAPMGPDPAALGEAARLMLAARRPAIVAGYAGRDPRAFTWIAQLAELLGAAVVDGGQRLNLPNRHPLAAAGGAVGEADAVLLLDVKDLAHPLVTVDHFTRRPTSRLSPATRVVDIGFNEHHVSSWIQDFGGLQPVDVGVTADTSVALPLLLERIHGAVAAEPRSRAADREARRGALAADHGARQATWAAEAARRHDERPISPSRLATEVWGAIRNTDWVLTAGTADDWALRLWDFDRPYRHPGRSLGTATQIGLSLGVALAHRGTGRLVVDLQPDGDLLFDVGALWIATSQRIPLLVVMYDNRAYYNDWRHQLEMARVRGTDPERAGIGIAIERPPDFAAVARGFDWFAEGPIEDPAAIGRAVARAARVVLDEGRPALVHVVCAHR